jgi:hypothetical protein
MESDAEFLLPGDAERAVVLGRTGSGKSYFLVWLLSHADVDIKPWIIIDHKRDGYLNSLPHVQKLALGELPSEPGLYIVSPTFKEDEQVDEYLHTILEAGDIGIFTDEGNKLPQREPLYVGLKSVFAQGRSKNVPVLFATQRPSWINKSVLSEGDYYALFHLQNIEDRARAGTVMPRDVIEKRLDTYHAHWYDVKAGSSFIIRPVDNDESLARLRSKLKPPVSVPRQRLNLI